MPVSCLHSRNYVADDFALIAQLSQEATISGSSDATEVCYFFSFSFCVFI